MALSLADVERHDPGAPERSKERRFLCPLPACADHQRAPLHRSFSVSRETGAFHCHRCGARGLLRERWQEPTQAQGKASKGPRRGKANYHAAREAARRALMLAPSGETHEQPQTSEVASQFARGGPFYSVPTMALAQDAPPVRTPAAGVDRTENTGQHEQSNGANFRATLAGLCLVPLCGTPGAAYLAGRSLAADNCHNSGVRFTANFYGRAAVVFPLYDGAGVLVAVQGRYIDGRDNPRMRTAGPKRRGAFATRGALVPGLPLVLTEAPIDALTLAAAGLPAVALCGCDGVPEWLKERAAWRVVIAAFDADVAGDRAAQTLAAALSLHGSLFLRFRPANGAKDWNAELQAHGPELLRARVSELLARVDAATSTVPGFYVDVPGTNAPRVFPGELLTERSSAVYAPNVGQERTGPEQTAIDAGPLVPNAAEKIAREALRTQAAKLLAGLETAPVAALLAAAKAGTLSGTVPVTAGRTITEPNKGALKIAEQIRAAVSNFACEARAGMSSQKARRAWQNNPALVGCDLADLQMLAAWYAEAGRTVAPENLLVCPAPVVFVPPPGPMLLIAGPNKPRDGVSEPTQNREQPGKPLAVETAGLLATVSTQPHAPGSISHWKTAYVDTVSGQGVTEEGNAVSFGERPPLAALLRFALQTGTRKIYLCGPVPGDGTQGAFEAWALAPEVGAEWNDAVRGKRSYYGDVQSAAAQADDFPAIRKTHQTQRHECHIYRAAAWFGDRVCTPPQARRALLAVADSLGRHFGHTGPVELLATPARTALELWKETARGTEYPALSDELQRLIKATSGQGRIELCTLPKVETVSQFVYLDARFAYAASLQNLPCGEPVHDELPNFERYARGRYRVCFTVPPGWNHVGLFMVKSDGAEKWEFPAVPGFTGETWAGASEVALALDRGWRVEVKERLLFPQAAGRAGDKKGPLDTWGARLTAAYQEADTDGDLLVKAALRSLLLFGIGSFARGDRPRRVVVPKAEVHTLPEDNPTIRRTARGDFEFWEREALPASARRYAHPEWAADIWARVRTRMLYYPKKQGRGEVVAAWGALCVPRADVLAIRTDALYLAYNPGFPDDGRPGSLRVKGQLLAETGPAIRAPRTFNDLNELRDRAETATDAEKELT